MKVSYMSLKKKTARIANLHTERDLTPKANEIVRGGIYINGGLDLIIVKFLSFLRLYD